MKYGMRITIALMVLLTSALACNMPGNSAEPALSVDEEAATIIAATLTADAGNRNNEPSATSTPSQTPPATITLTTGPTATITPTYSVPILTVLEQTNCREGPSLDYEVLFTYLPDKKLEIVGRYDPNNYWLVKSNDSPTGSCWLWGEYVELAGSYWVVPTLTPPPTITPVPAAAPSIQKWDFFCSSVRGEMEMSIKWTDLATNETGYRVIRDNVVVAELPANSTSYTETILLDSGESATYIIEAYNAVGSGMSTPIKLTC